MIDDPLIRTKARRGTECTNAKLTEADVMEIHEMLRQKAALKRKLARLTNASIAEMYGVHQRTIDRVVQGYGWTHVEVAA